MLITQPILFTAIVDVIILIFMRIKIT